MSFFGQITDTIRYLVKKADMVLLALILIATVFGLLLIASATNYLDWETQLRRILIQAAAACIGLGMYFLFSTVDVEHFSEKWWLFFLFNLVVFMDREPSCSHCHSRCQLLSHLVPVSMLRVLFRLVLFMLQISHTIVI